MILVQKETFRVRGLSVRTTNQDETQPETAKIARLWQEFATAWAGNGLNLSKAFGVYSDYDSDMNGEFTVTAAMPGDFPLPAGHEVTIPAGTYLCFEGSGPCPATVITLWQEVWTYFSHNDSLARTYRCDFEEYNGPESVAIFIGVTDGKEERA